MRIIARCAVVGFLLLVPASAIAQDSYNFVSGAVGEQMASGLTLQAYSGALGRQLSLGGGFGVAISAGVLVTGKDGGGQPAVFPVTVLGNVTFRRHSPLTIVTGAGLAVLVRDFPRNAFDASAGIRYWTSDDRALLCDVEFQTRSEQNVSSRMIAIHVGIAFR